MSGLHIGRSVVVIWVDPARPRLEEHHRGQRSTTEIFGVHRMPMNYSTLGLCLTVLTACIQVTLMSAMLLAEVV